MCEARSKETYSFEDIYDPLSYLVRAGKLASVGSRCPTSGAAFQPACISAAPACGPKQERSQSGRHREKPGYVERPAFLRPAEFLDLGEWRQRSAAYSRAKIQG